MGIEGSEQQEDANNDNSALKVSPLKKKNRAFPLNSTVC